MRRIETRRMVLRAFVPEDAVALRSLAGQAMPAEELGGRPLEYNDDARAWIAWANLLFEDVRGYWAAEEAGRVVGWFYLLPGESEEPLEAGFLIRRDAKGYGLGTEGMRALLRIVDRPVVLKGSSCNDALDSMAKIGFRRVREEGLRVVIVREPWSDS